LLDDNGGDSGQNRASALDNVTTVQLLMCWI
jgi:hypothetical protein